MNISRTTLYKELEKNNIIGKKITEEELEILQKSVKGVKSVSLQKKTQNANIINNNNEQKRHYEQSLIDKDNKYNSMLIEQKGIIEQKNKEIVKLEEKNIKLEEKVLLLERDNRQLLQDLHNANVITSKISQQNIELIDKTQKLLLAPKEDKVKQEEAVVEEVKVEPKVDQEVKKKKWWQR